MSLASRVGRLERAADGDDEARRVVVWHSPNYSESWVERGEEIINFHVRTDGPGEDPPHGVEVGRTIAPQPHHGFDPLRYLTAEMRAMLRPGDLITTFEVGPMDRRNPHLQMHIPPWKRRPWRLDSSGRSYELLDEDGTWHRHEFDR